MTQVEGDTRSYSSHQSTSNSTSALHDNTRNRGKNNNDDAASTNTEVFKYDLHYEHCLTHVFYITEKQNWKTDGSYLRCKGFIGRGLFAYSQRHLHCSYDGSFDLCIYNSKWSDLGLHYWQHERFIIHIFDHYASQNGCHGRYWIVSLKLESEEHTILTLVSYSAISEYKWVRFQSGGQLSLLDVYDACTRGVGG